MMMMTPVKSPVSQEFSLYGKILHLVIHIQCLTFSAKVGGSVCKYTSGERGSWEFGVVHGPVRHHAGHLSLGGGDTEFWPHDLFCLFIS